MIRFRPLPSPTASGIGDLICSVSVALLNRYNERDLRFELEYYRTVATSERERADLAESKLKIHEAIFDVLRDHGVEVTQNPETGEWSVQFPCPEDEDDEYEEDAHGFLSGILQRWSAICGVAATHNNSR